jgi:hypothetical protein
MQKTILEYVTKIFAVIAFATFIILPVDNANHVAIFFVTCLVLALLFVWLKSVD